MPTRLNPMKCFLFVCPFFYWNLCIFPVLYLQTFCIFLNSEELAQSISIFPIFILLFLFLLCVLESRFWRETFFFLLNRRKTSFEERRIRQTPVVSVVGDWRSLETKTETQRFCFYSCNRGSEVSKSRGLIPSRSTVVQPPAGWRLPRPQPPPRSWPPWPQPAPRWRPPRPPSPPQPPPDRLQPSPVSALALDFGSLSRLSPVHLRWFGEASSPREIGHRRALVEHLAAGAGCPRPQSVVSPVAS